jgi:hypothetical protein
MRGAVSAEHAVSVPSGRHEETTWRIEGTYDSTFITKIDDNGEIRYTIAQTNHELRLTSEAAIELYAMLGTALNWPPGGIPHDRI